MSIYNRVKGKISRIHLQAAIASHNMYNSLTGPSRLKRSLKNNKPSRVFEAINADQPREVEFRTEDAALQEVIFTCYFVTMKDPHSKIIRRNADINYIAPWYNSISKLNVTGIIIHDGLDQSFIDQYQTNRILFRKYTPGNYSIFEERWMAYYLFLSQSKIQRAFLSDINDVYITGNPFTRFNQNLTLYVGRDIANKIKDSGWMLTELSNFEKEAQFRAPQLFQHQYVYNAGVIGGSRSILLFLISRVIDYVLRGHTSDHKDMTILNLCIYDHFFPLISSDLSGPKLNTDDEDKKASHAHLVTGYPLNSRFSRQELTSDAYFIHK